MNMPLRSALAIVLLAAAAAPAAAGDVKLSMTNGRVTLIARDATVREILAEWARVGQTRIVNAEKLAGTPVTLELTDVPEAQALDTVLRSAAGYVMAPRSAGSPGSSVYDRILILASSRPPVVTAAAPAPFPNRQPQPMPGPQNAQPDDGAEFAPPVNPGFINGNQVMPGMVPGMVQPQQVLPQGPMTAPRPGQLPAPPVVPNNNGLNNGLNNGFNNGINTVPNAPPQNPYLGVPPGPPVPGFNPNPPPPAPRGPGGNRGGE